MQLCRFDPTMSVANRRRQTSFISRSVEAKNSEIDCQIWQLKLFNLGVALKSH